MGGKAWSRAHLQDIKKVASFEGMDPTWERSGGKHISESEITNLKQGKHKNKNQEQESIETTRNEE